MENSYNFEVLGKTVYASFFQGDGDTSDVWYITIDGRQRKIIRGWVSLKEMMLIVENMILVATGLEIYSCLYLGIR